MSLPVIDKSKQDHKFKLGDTVRISKTAPNTTSHRGKKAVVEVVRAKSHRFTLHYLVHTEDGHHVDASEADLEPCIVKVMHAYQDNTGVTHHSSYKFPDLELRTLKWCYTPHFNYEIDV